MRKSPTVRKFALTLHVVSSVGWLGSVVAFLALSFAALTSREAQTVRATYLSMEIMGRWALVPFSIASLVTGIIQSLVTKWGLFRHYWVLAKLLINVLASVILLSYTQTLRSLADVAVKQLWSNEELAILRSPTTAIHGIGGLLLLVLATVLSIYKPAGLTAYGWRRRRS